MLIFVREVKSFIFSSVLNCAALLRDILSVCQVSTGRLPGLAKQRQTGNVEKLEQDISAAKPKYSTTLKNSPNLKSVLFIKMQYTESLLPSRHRNK
jgi:hypothetical protein